MKLSLKMFQKIQNNVQDEGKPLDLSEDCALLHCTEVKKTIFYSNFQHSLIELSSSSDPDQMTNY